MSLLSNGWVEDIGTWLLGLVVAAAFAHRHVVRLRELHAAIRRSDSAGDSSDSSDSSD